MISVKVDTFKINHIYREWVDQYFYLLKKKIINERQICICINHEYNGIIRTSKVLTNKGSKKNI